VKVYLSDINESWIVDRVREEWYKYNPELSSKNIKTADTIWIISPWLWGKLPKKYLKKCKVVCSIFHFEEKDYNPSNIKEFYKRDKYVDSYHVISQKVLQELQKLTPKPITYIPFWVNQDIWYEIENKEKLKLKYNIPVNSFVIGSFQRDTEGKDLKSPKLIKGPDRFVEIAKYYKSLHPNLIILLSGKRRQYIINELNKENISFLYYEMASFEELNEFYNILDLYIVSSRIEGGPQAIVESGITKTPIISTDVGFASDILSNESIFDMNNFKNAKPNIDFAYKKSKELVIPKGFEKFINMLS
jgi:glycosyltransferase involved in cell wall biosynthesis